MDKSSPMTQLSQPMVILARHGQTALNSGALGSAERLRGWKDVPLNAAGKSEAKQLGQELSSYPISNVLSSDLSRASTTAKAVAKPHNIQPILTQNLRPWNLGDFTGQPVKDVKDKMQDYVNNPEQPIPNGESFNQFKNRFLTTLQMVLDHVKTNNSAVALVSHTRNQQLTKAWLAAGGSRDFDISNQTMNDYSNQGHTGNYQLILPDKTGGWNLHQISNSEPRTYEEYNRAQAR